MALSIEARQRWRQRFMSHFSPAVRLPKDIDLSRLTDAERAELIELLEARVANAELQRSLIEGWVGCTLDDAAAADNSETYCAVAFAHEVARSTHMARLTAARPVATTPAAFLAEFAADTAEAGRRAQDDGFPEPVAERATVEAREVTTFPRLSTPPVRHWQRQIPAPEPKPEPEILPPQPAPWLRSVMPGHAIFEE